MPRKATIERKTKETDIKISLDLDGTATTTIPSRTSGSLSARH
jgi:imidazoleglycerol phosphate dehydratase HisB